MAHSALWVLAPIPGVTLLFFFADAYFIVEWYVDQLDDEGMEKHAPNNMGQHSINNYGPTYAFSAPGNGYGVTAAQDPSTRV